MPKLMEKATGQRIKEFLESLPEDCEHTGGIVDMFDKDGHFDLALDIHYSLYYLGRVRFAKSLNNFSIKTTVPFIVAFNKWWNEKYGN